MSLPTTMPALKTVRAKPTATTQTPSSTPALDEPYNFVLQCGNRVEIFTKDRFADLPQAVEKLLLQGHTMDDITLGILEAEDPFH